MSILSISTQSPGIKKKNRPGGRFRSGTRRGAHEREADNDIEEGSIILNLLEVVPVAFLSCQFLGGVFPRYDTQTRLQILYTNIDKLSTISTLKF